MQLSDEQILLLEQLTYLTDEVAEEAGIAPGKYTSVEDLLKKFGEEQLKELEGSDVLFSGHISGSEWAAIIRKIQQDPQLYALEIADKNDDVYALVFTDPNDPGSAIVSFRGTGDEREWADNVDGLYETDTECQKEALEYIENLPYDDITVSGHSKGGNKAQYVTILSDKINRCVSMDGQGFSQEFFDKYYAEIQNKSGCIKNYYLEADFVNILMFPVPGSEQICVEGKDGVVLGYNHSSGSFFQYERDENGNWRLKTDPDGSITILPGERSELMQYLHDFTCFLLNVMPIEDRRDAAEYIRFALALAMSSDDYSIEVNGKTYTKDNLMDYLLSDPEMLSLVLAYFLKYVDTYNLTEDEIRALAEFIGLDTILSLLESIDFSDPKVLLITGGVALFGDDLYEFLFEQLKDGERDGIILKLLQWAQEALGWDVDVASIWENTDQEYQNIPDFNPETATNNGTAPTGRVRDFSQAAYDLLIATIDSIEAGTYGSVSGWTRYADEDWYDSLLISSAVRGINKYCEQITEINQNCKAQITRIFEEADQADEDNAGKLREIVERFHRIQNTISELAQI